jgi:hypothetical protein
MYDNLMKQNTDKEGKSSLHPEIQEHLKFGVGLFYVKKFEINFHSTLSGLIFVQIHLQVSFLV